MLRSLNEVLPQCLSRSPIQRKGFLYVISTLCVMAQNVKKNIRNIEFYSERPIKSARDLLEFIEALDEDEGVRVEGNVVGHIGGGFIFVGYYRGSYCVNICDRIWNPRLRKHVAGERDEWYYFDKGREAYDFVVKEARNPIRAWLY